MSGLVGAREQVAAALSSVPGVTGHVRRPGTARPGDAWPLLGSLVRGPGYTWEITWRVLVLLPGDESAAADWIDATADAVLDALAPWGFVDRMEPVVVGSGDAARFAVEITMRSE